MIASYKPLEGIFIVNFLIRALQQSGVVALGLVLLALTLKISI